MSTGYVSGQSAAGFADHADNLAHGFRALLAQGYTAAHPDGIVSYTAGLVRSGEVGHGPLEQ
jgi:hypothetical protein